IGQAYMNAFEVLTSEDTEWKDYTPAECPTEFLMDVFWTQQEQKSAREQALEEAAQIAELHEGEPCSTAIAWTDEERQFYASGQQDASSSIATAIRVLKSQPAPQLQSLVIIESPYAGDIAANESYARACLL